MRNRFQINPTDPEGFKIRILFTCDRYTYAQFLDSNEHKDEYGQYDWIAALGSKEVFSSTSNSFEKLKEFRLNHKDWLFGHLTYDLKNEIELIKTEHPRHFNFPHLLFFIPKTVIYSKDGQIWTESLEFENEQELIHSLGNPTMPSTKQSQVTLSPKTSRSEYLDDINSLKSHLQYGNIYEINYCIEFATQHYEIDPTRVFKRLNSSARAPFSGFYKCDDQFLICASPERYLQKTGNRIISQPIKGTARRSPDKATDQELKEYLTNSEKEQSENVMITDLVRNDLSRTAERASVKVDKLFDIQTYNTVHHMISTVRSTLQSKFEAEDVIETTFPMGSMTGAPKVSAMQLIDEHENMARELFAGSIGYFTPEGNFDFNVVIRSLLYNRESGYLSARVGSAITIHCEAEKEYEECLLKAENLFKALSSEILSED